MSKLNLFGRPWTVFDPDNKEHRRWYHQFVQTQSWGHCPVRFVVPEDHGDLVMMIQRTLVAYYVNKEFKNTVLPAPLVRQKKQKKVDN